MRRRSTKKINASYIHPFIDGSRFYRGIGEQPRTLRELAMTRFSAELRSKPNWWTAYKNPETKQLWYNEAVNKTWRVGPETNNIEAGLSICQIEYILDELAGYAFLRDESDGIEVSCFDRIWQSEALTVHQDCERLSRCLDILRSCSPALSNQDLLVDPLRHSYHHAKSVLRQPDEFESFLGYLDISSRSSTYTALPSLATVYRNPSRAKFRSYINGVDPSLTELTAALQSALTQSITLFETVLTSLHRSNPLPQRIKGSYRYKVWDEPDPPEDSDEEAWEEHSRELREWMLYRPIEIPDIPNEGYCEDTLRFAHKVRFAENQNIQVFTRVTDILLDSKRRAVPDTKWRVEGMANEQISVCCFHFISVEGIDDAQISFRMATAFPSHFMSHDVGATLRTWGVQHGDECNQFLGSARLRSSLSIAFPNIYQHRIQGVKLRDGYERGRLTILEFYLVDPDVPPVVSTADVAPQQRGWILRALEESIDKRLPQEILEKIVDMVDSVFSDEEAEKYRAEIAQEREVFREVNNRNYFCLPFNLYIL